MPRDSRCARSFNAATAASFNPVKEVRTSLHDSTNVAGTAMASIRSITLAALAVGTVFTGCGPAYAADDANFDQIETVVLIYAENRSLDNLYGHFPGANGLQNVSAEMAQQFDRDGTLLKELPPIWGGLTAKGVVPEVT